MPTFRHCHRARQRRAVLFTMAAMSVAAGLAACSQAPEPVATRAGLPDTFSRSGDAPRVDRWWRRFDDATLSDLVERALADEPGLRATWARLVQATAVAGRTRAERFPSIDGTGEARIEDGSELRMSRESYALGLSASYEVDLWGRVDARADAARLDARASRQDLRAAALTLSGEVADAWYRLLAERARLDLLRQQLETNTKVERVVNVRVRQGQAALADLLRQRELVERTREQIATAEGEIAQIEHELAVLLGRAPGTADVPDARALPAAPPLPETGVPAELLQRRPDVRERLLRVQAADKRVAAAVADQYPRIDLTGALSTNSAEPAKLFTSWMGNLASQLTVPLIDAGQRESEVDRTQAVVAERLAQYEETALTAIREVEDALARERQQRRRVASLREQVELARQSVERLRGRYIGGNTDFLDVLDALTRVQDLERTLIDARRARLAARIELARALAGGVTPPRPDGRGFAPLAVDAADAGESGDTT
jgi:NodT family efflux transporter outer membrane factor (OMF) lipoprotein